MKLNERQANVISMIIMVAIMTCVVTLVMAFINGNFVFTKWLTGWVLSFLVAVPTVLVVMPSTKRLVSNYIKK